jgi:DNA modification methylase
MQLLSFTLPVPPALPKPFYKDALITLYHGCAEQILPLLAVADLLLTDPPYGIGIAARGRIGNGKAHTPKNWDAEPPPLWLMQMAITRAKSAIVWGGTYIGLGRATCSLVWDKCNDGMSFSQAEIAWTNLPAKATRVFRRRVNASLPVIDREERIHPTQKPVALLEWCLSKVKGCQTVIDPFAGSAATLVAARRAGIRAIGIERDFEYCRLAANRLRKERGTAAELDAAA